MELPMCNRRHGTHYLRRRISPSFVFERSACELGLHLRKSGRNQCALCYNKYIGRYYTECAKHLTIALIPLC